MKVDPGSADMDAARLHRINEQLTRSYLQPGKIAGGLTAVARHGAVAHFSCLGLADRERQHPVAADTIWRAQLDS